MPKPKPKLFFPALILAALLAFPVAAQATLSFTRSPFHPAVFVASDDGSGARRIANGSSPHVSPDGLSVAFLHEGAKHAQELQVANLSTGITKTLMTDWREPFYLEWSPDSTLIAALRGPELGKRKLVLIDVVTGAQRVIAQGFFSGFSFEPEGHALIYGRASSEKFPPHSDIYWYTVSQCCETLLPQYFRMTHDHNSSHPIWGPSGEIVFVKAVEGKNRKYGPKTELYLMNRAGKDVKRLTHTKVDPLLQGLFPTDWSADGKHLLAEFEGQDTSYAVGVDFRTGRQHPIAAVGERGFIGTAISDDGESVLGYTGGFDPQAPHDVAIAPFAGGMPRVKVKNASEPDWNR